MHILSGSGTADVRRCRPVVACSSGIAFGLNFSGLVQLTRCTRTRSVGFPWWASVVGTPAVWGGHLHPVFRAPIATCSGCCWSCTLPCWANLSASVMSTRTLGPFLGATLMALSSEFIARSPRRTPAHGLTDAWPSGSWCPAARGLLSVTSILSGGPAERSGWPWRDADPDHLDLIGRACWVL